MFIRKLYDTDNAIELIDQAYNELNHCIIHKYECANLIIEVLNSLQNPKDFFEISLNAAERIKAIGTDLLLHYQEVLLNKLKYGFQFSKGIGAPPIVKQLYLLESEKLYTLQMIDILENILPPLEIFWYKIENDHVMSCSKNEWIKWREKNSYEALPICVDKIEHVTITTYFTGMLTPVDVTSPGYGCEIKKPNIDILFFTNTDGSIFLDVPQEISKQHPEFYKDNFYSDLKTARKSHKLLVDISQKIRLHADSGSVRLNKLLRSFRFPFTPRDIAGLILNLQPKFYNYNGFTEYLGLEYGNLKYGASNIGESAKFFSVDKNKALIAKLKHPRFDRELIFCVGNKIQFDGSDEVVFHNIKELIEEDLIFIEISKKEDWLLLKAKILNSIFHEDLTEKYQTELFKHPENVVGECAKFTWLINEDNFFLKTLEGSCEIYCSEDFYKKEKELIENNCSEIEISNFVPLLKIE